VPAHFDDPDFLDPQALAAEEDRVFALCGDCRLCVKYCDTFPIVFDAIDAQSGGDDEIRTGEERLNPEQRRAAVEACFGCQACYTNCPYVPGKHEWDLDFPLLMLRAKAVHAQQKGVALKDRLLTDPDFAGRQAATPMNALANWSMAQGSIHRTFAEWALGIDRRKFMPRFERKGFTATPEGQAREASGSPEPGAADGARAAAPAEVDAGYTLFPSCTGQWNDHETPAALMDVMERAGIAVRAAYPGCCGMPALDVGDLDRARRMARKVVKGLLLEARAGRKLVIINPTCGLMIREEYKHLIPDEPGLEEVVEALTDSGTVLWSLAKAKKMDRDFTEKPTELVYHAACHLQRQQIGFKGRDVLRVFKGAKLTTADRCSCHDGTWAMKKEHFDDSLRIGKALFSVVESNPEATVVTECPLAALHIEQATGRKAVHPAVVIRDANTGELARHGGALQGSDDPEEP
jgi:Fe-S oxidoreductase